jgi:uncharacterized protein
MIIGRNREIALFKELEADKQSHFVAVYGRRRVGKTFLIQSHFNSFCFYHTGVDDSSMTLQLERFYKSVKKYSNEKYIQPTSWFEAFDILEQIITESKDKKKVVFIDEMPWMDTPRSKFITALESFWNGFGAGRKDLIMVICGSATSWIVKKIFKNKKGLHNRVIHIKRNPKFS